MAIEFRKIALVVTFSTLANATSAEVIARCGPSHGYGWYFQDPFWKPDGSSWMDDGISDGAIILERRGEDYDIRFSDVAGGFTYRSDGATVLLLGQEGGRMTVGAFRGNYADIYTFDLINAEVAWTSQKLGPLAPKVAVYRAECGI